MQRDPASSSSGSTGPSDGSTAGGARGRPRGNAPVTGIAVPRASVAPAPGGGTVIVNTYYPWWWFGGVGFYGGYYGLSSYYGGYPYASYGGYPYASYGGYYDPWFGAYPDPTPPAYSGDSGTFAGEGTLRLKIKPPDAEVYVDGYYVGVVSDFNGIFHKLHIEGGQHRVEVRAPGYESLTFDVEITPDHATTYQGDLKRIQ